MSTSEGYVLNTLQTPEPIRPLYDAIDRGITTREKLEAELGFDDERIRDNLNGLQQYRMIGKEEYEYHTAGFAFDTGDDDRDFRLSILHNLARECRPPDWGKQSVVLLIYKYLLEHGIQYFENDDEDLYDKIDDWYRNELGYDPYSSQGPITLNRPKFVNWSRQANFLGLIYKTNGREHAVRPDSDLIEASIRLAADGDTYIGIREYFGWLQEHLVPVELQDGAVPPSLARILFELVREDVIRLVERGDAGAVDLDDVPQRMGIDAEANTIEVMS
jgi:hypothetical protein